MPAVNAIPVIGGPLAWGIGFGILLLVVFTDSWGRSLVTVAHEGGHMVLAVLTFRGHKGFTLADGGGGGTEPVKKHWSVSDIVTRFVGYPTPCLLGLGGAAAVAGGNAWGVLWASLILLVWSFFQAANPLANAVTLLATIGVAFAALRGTAYIQTLVAVALVWWMLLGGAYWSFLGLRSGGTGDSTMLARRTLIPRGVWDVAHGAIGIVCLWSGGRYLLFG